MSSDETLDARLKAIARTAVAGESIADDVMRRVEQEDAESHPAPEVSTIRQLPRGRLWSVVRRPVALPIAAAIGLAVGVLLGLGLSTRATQTSPPETSASGPPVPIAVSSLKGTVFLKRSASSTWNELAKSSPLYVGDTYQASPKSEMVLSCKDGSTIVLSANSRLALDHCDGGIQLSLAHGFLKADLKSPHPPFFVHTPAGRIEALGTEFTVSVE